MKIADCLLVLLFLTIWATSSSAAIVDRIVAIVNNDVITLSELEQKAAPVIQQYLKKIKKSKISDEKKKEIYAKILPQLIDEHLIEKEINKLGIKVSDRDVDATVQRICQENNISLEQLKKKLAADGFSLKDYKKEIRQQIERAQLINAQVKSKIVITDQQVISYLKKHPVSGVDIQGNTPRYVLQHICIVPKDPQDSASRAKARAKAEQALSELKAGKDFGAVAARYSDLPDGKTKGLLGAFTKKEMAPFVRNAVLRLKQGDFSAIVDTPVGFQIFRLKAIETGTKSVDKRIMEKVRNELYLKQVNARFEQWLQDLRSKSTIRILL